MRVSRFCHALIVLATLGGLVLFGCSENIDEEDGYQPDQFGSPPGCDPDGLEPCPQDWFLCVEDDMNGKRCEGQHPAVPDDGTWVCIVEGESIVCQGDHMPDDSDRWECEEDGSGFVTCTSDAYEPAVDAGADAVWDCWYEGEFVVCEAGDYSGGDGDGDGDVDGDGDGDGDSDDDADGDGDGDLPGGGADICFFAAADPEGPPLVTGWYEFEVVDGVMTVHVILAFNEAFVDNTYGVNSSPGYDHKFRDLVGSDKAEVGFLNGDGEEVLHIKLDYISESDEAPSGYDCGGVWFGEGKVEEGDESWVIAATSSLDRNLNDLGCVFLEDSPIGDECPGWDYRVVYEVWIDASAFGPSGFLMPVMTEVHASPSRTENTIEIEPGPCP